MTVARNTESERRAVESLVGKIKRSKAEFGNEVSAEAARRQAVRIAERSDAERRDGKKK